MKMEWTYPEGGNIKYRHYNMLLANSSQHIIEDSISCFGRWNSSSSTCCTKGVVYLIIGDGNGMDTVKFINDNADVDEASVKMFDLATQKQYTAQFKKLEEKEVVVTPPTKTKTIKKKK